MFAKDDIIIAIYIDNLLICGAEKKVINKVKNALKAKFHMSDLEPVVFLFEIAVTQDCINQIFCFSQEIYLEKNLKDYEL